MAKRKGYVVSLVIEDSGNWPLIDPENLWEHITLKLPSGLTVGYYKVRREGDPNEAVWRRQGKQKARAK